MPTGIPTNRTNIDLPPAISAEIIQTTTESSAIMQLARQIELPGRGTTIPVITGDPEAAWVGETEKKPVSNPGVTKKIMQPYKLAVLVPFSMEFRRDAAALYDALVSRLPDALGRKFDQTVIGAVAKPGDNFDSLGDADAFALTTGSEYEALVNADAHVSAAGGITNGVALSPQGKSALLKAVDGDKRPLFVNNVSEGAIPYVLGAPVYLNRGLYKAAGEEETDLAVVGILGDWTKALYGTVEGVRIGYSEDATLTIDGEQVNLFEQNMFAVKAEIEIGFRADVDAFARLTLGE